MSEYEEIFQSMYEQLLADGQPQREAHRIATEPATQTVILLRKRGEID